VGSEAFEQEVEVGRGELPLERGGDLLVVVLEGQQRGLCLGEAAEVVWGQDFALDDREVDLDLVEPGGVDGQVDQVQGGPGALEPAAWPRWLLPLSTTQNTLRAEA
jgi:hypothetical protein